jgi:hypothetical protein
MSDLLTVEQVAQILRVSPETVTRRFAKVKGVIDIGSPETPKKRRYRVLRIPKTVVEKYMLAHGGPVRVEVPPTQKKPSRGSTTKSQPTEDDLVRDLATLASQHGATARKFVEKIAERARLMTFVPESQWSEVVWLDDEDRRR